MSDPLREECGIALIRLLKPLSHYQEKYGTTLWGFHKLFLLMEKQHNRGQDGAGIGMVKTDVRPGDPYLYRLREVKNNPLDSIFNRATGHYDQLVAQGVIDPDDPQSVKRHFPFCGEIYLGHLRYGTSGGYHQGTCHPYLRKSTWPAKALMLAGNFNITNTGELNDDLIERGQHPVFDTDTQTLLEEIGYQLDQEHNTAYARLRESGLRGTFAEERIGEDLDLGAILRRAAQKWDGGFSLVGAVGNGDCFAFRDPTGIRPLFYFQDDEVAAFASERAPLMTVFNLEREQVREVERGSAVVVKKNGVVSVRQVLAQREERYCSFERIYFSRGNDPEIYVQRKALGAALADQVLTAVEGDLDRTVFSFIPNTAEIAYYGLTQELKLRRRAEVKSAILAAAAKGEVTPELLDDLILKNWPRLEKVAWKDIKLRTFISQEKSRKQLASHVYDISYGSVNPGDNLVCIDDSIVRGTTLKTSIIKILARLKPGRILIVSTAPQIRYPDCYGIDMSRLNRFIAFQAAVELLKEDGREALLKEVYEECLDLVKRPFPVLVNPVKRIYKELGTERISAQITKLVSPPLPYWKGEVKIIFQTIENLHGALPEHCGDWYFTGDYPTPGGFRVVQRAFVNYFEKREGRSY